MKKNAWLREVILILGLAGTGLFPVQGLAQPSTEGILRGTVISLGYCDMNPHAHIGATVVIESSTGSQWNLQTGPTGEYQMAVDEAESPFVVNVSATEHQANNATGVSVAAGRTTTQDFALRWLKSCVTVDPAELSVNLKWGGSIVLPLRIFSLGAAALTWEVNEQPAGGVAWLSENPVSGNLAADGGQQVLDIGLASSLVPGPGEYLGWLHLVSNDPVNPDRAIPVRMSVFAYGATLSPDFQSGWGTAGERVEYLLQLTNAGTVADVFKMTAGSSRWAVDLTPTLAGLEAGRSLPVTVGVTIPGITPPGAFDLLEITAQSQGDPVKISKARLNTLAAYYLFLPLVNR